MRRTVFRFLAVALLVLAVPVQGVAAVTVGQCIAFGHHEEGAGYQSHAHAHDGATGHDHAAHSHGDDGATTQADEGGQQPHCGPCTACCASASITGAAEHALPTALTKTAYAFSQFPPLGVQPDGVYRPPLAL